MIKLKSFAVIVSLFCASAAIAQDSVNGFASVAGQGLTTTTGGGNATPITVTNFAGLSSAVSGSTPRVIMISGTIKTTDGGGFALNIGPNKTLKGVDNNATIYGGISLSANTIVQNLNLQGTYPNSGPDDVLHVQGSGVHHIWIDHCNIWNATDGNLDITGQASYVTVSWCKFWYTDPTHPHRLSCLIGSGGGDHPEDWGYLKVTFHHNWFADLVKERMPRLMYGQAHVYNNYYTCSGNLYCIGVGSYGEILVENNHFQNVNNPHQFMYDVYCYLTARGNVYVNTTGLKDNGLGGSRFVTNQNFVVEAFTNPPYAYTLDNAANVPAIVTNGVGPQAQSTVPSGLTAIPSDGQISLSWSTAIGATNYLLKRSITSGSGYLNILTNSATAFTNKGLLNGTTYYYVVSALSSNGESADSSQASATPQVFPPTGLAATAGDAQVSLTWTASITATNYVVKRSTTNDGPYNSIFTNAATSYTDIGLVNGTTYYYVVSALNIGGESPDSSQASATPLAFSSDLVAYEGFNYALNTSVANQGGGIGWGATWGTATDPASALATNNANGLTYGNGTVQLVTSGGSVIVGNPAGTAATTAQIQRRLPNTLTNILHGGGSVWISFLYQNPQTTKGNFAGFRETGLRLMRSATTNTAGYSNRDGSDVLDAGSPNTYSSGANFDELSLFLAPSYVHNGHATPRGSNPTNVVFVVLRLDVDNTTGNDTAYAWFFQNGNGLSAEPGIGSALVFATASLSDINAFRFQAGNANANGTNAFWALDEIRVGTTYAAVAPTTTLASNTAPVLQSIFDRIINVGYTLTIENDAVDYDIPAQTLTYTLPTAPTNATIGSISGNLSWRPLVTQANTTNAFSVVVTDNGTPSMSATQTFNVFVNPLTLPSILSSQISSGQIGLTVSGQAGPDYAIQVSTNLTNWTTLLITNPASLPFSWNSSTETEPAQFYRIMMGPPLP